MTIKLKKVFSLLFVLILGLAFVKTNVKAGGDVPQVNVSIYATIDGANSDVGLIDTKVNYGSTINTNFDAITAEFAFWVVNGVIDLEKDQNTSFVATNQLNAVAVFSSGSDFVKVYIDHNGQLIDAFYGEAPTGLVEPNKVGYVFDEWREVETINDVTVYKATYTLVHDDVLVNNVETAYNSIVSLTGDLESVWLKDGKVVSYNKDYAFSALADTEVAQRALAVGEEAVNVVSLETLDEYRENYTTYLAQVGLVEGTIVEYGLELDGVLRRATLIHNLTNEFLISTKLNYTSVRAYAIISKGESFEYVYSDYVGYITDASIVYDLSVITEKGTNIDAEGLSALFAHEYLEAISEASSVTLGNQSGSTNYSGFNGLLKSGTGSAEGKIVFEFKDNILIETVVLYVAAWNDSTKTIKVNNIDIAEEINPMESRVVVKLEEAINIITYTTAKQGLLFGIEFYGENSTVLPANTVDVTFKYNDGVTDDLVKTIFKNRKVFAPTNPTWEGYEFLGWFEDLLDEDSYDLSDNISADLVLYAKWEKLAEGLIFFGEFDYKANIAYGDTEATFTNSIGNDMNWILKEVFVQKGQTDENMLRLRGANLAYLYTAKALEEVTTISFDVKANGSSHTNAIVKVYYLEVGQMNWVQIGSNITFTNIEFLNVNIPIEKENVRIKIEATEKTVNIDNLKIFGVHENEVSDPSYTVTFNTNGGTPIPSTQTLNIFDKVSKPSNPEKSGHTFMGWYDNAGFTGNVWDFDNDLMPNYNITLYAQWEEGQGEMLLYSTGWEDTTLPGSTSYTPIIRERETSGIVWELYQGEVVTSGSPLTGSKNAQFRISNSNAGPAYLNMKSDFIAKEITKISFNASMANQSGTTKALKIYYKLDSGDWVLFDTLEPGTSKTPFEIIFKNSLDEVIEGIVNIKFEISYSGAVSANRDTKIDDIEIYGFNLN